MNELSVAKKTVNEVTIHSTANLQQPVFCTISLLNLYYMSYTGDGCITACGSRIFFIFSNGWKTLNKEQYFMIFSLYENQICVHKVWLEPCCIHLVSYCLPVLSCYWAELSHFNRDPVASKSSDPSLEGVQPLLETKGILSSHVRWANLAADSR